MVQNGLFKIGYQYTTTINVLKDSWLGPVCVHEKVLTFQKVYTLIL